MVLFGSNCAGGDDEGGCFGVDLWLCWVHSPEQFSSSRSWKRTLHYHYFLRFHSLTQQVTSACPPQCAHNGVHHRWHNGKWCELWWWYCFSVAMLPLLPLEFERVKCCVSDASTPAHHFASQMIVIAAAVVVAIRSHFSHSRSLKWCLVSAAAAAGFVLFTTQ